MHGRRWQSALVAVMALSMWGGTVFISDMVESTSLRIKPRLGVQESGGNIAKEIEAGDSYFTDDVSEITSPQKDTVSAPNIFPRPFVRQPDFEGTPKVQRTQTSAPVKDVQTATPAVQEQTSAPTARSQQQQTSAPTARLQHGPTPAAGGYSGYGSSSGGYGSSGGYDGEDDDDDDSN
jgi:hypothetical protein